MKAGASSVWASCCGLLNEVMGSGAVRGQQPGFGPAAGPFRFAPSAAYTTYPPTSSGSVGPTCKACGLTFSVFRRKHICCDCKKNFCALCSVLQENLRRCATCHLLWGTAFQRPQLMRLRVKDLRQYLQLRNIPTDTCREKEDLVELVLCHQGVSCGHGDGDEEEDDDDDEEEEEEEEEVAAAAEDDTEEEEPNEGSLRLQAPGPSQTTPSPSQTTPSPYVCEQAALSTPQGVPLSRSDSSGASDQDEEDDDVPVSLMNLDLDESKVEEAGPLARERARISLSDLSSEQDIGALTVRQLKEILARNFVSYSGCLEKWELVERVGRLYRHTEQNRKSLESFSNSITADGERLPLAGQDDNLCRICMDAVIDCVLLECGHMVTCTKCGKRMSECPICRQYVVRAVHVFKS